MEQRPGRSRGMARLVDARVAAPPGVAVELGRRPLRRDPRRWTLRPLLADLADRPRCLRARRPPAPIALPLAPLPRGRRDGAPGRMAPRADGRRRTPRQAR